MVISICKSMSILVVFLSALLILPIFGYSQQAKILPGTYVTKGGWGNMSIAKKNGSLVFEINAIGANGHTCDLGGQINNGKAVLEGPDEKTPCIVKFELKGNNIEVSDNDGACHYYCGARAGFTGLYMMPAVSCS